MTTTDSPNFDLTQFFGPFREQEVPFDAVMRAQQRNIDALVAANKAFVSNIQALVQREQEMTLDAIAEWQTAASEIASSADFEDRTTRQAEMVAQAMEQAVRNMREIADMVAKTQEDTMAIVNKRIDDGIDEIRLQFPKKGR